MTAPQARGVPRGSGIIRTCPQDFIVDEVLGFEPDGAGEHLFVQVEKTGANTAWVGSRLAQFAGVRPRDVSYAGRKDRHAVARQWFSIWLPGRGDPRWEDCEIDGVRFLKSVRHGRKLRRGALAGNRFAIIVRQVSGATAEIDKRLVLIQQSGVPNFFGPQRFGRGGSNLDLARNWFSGAIRLHGTKRSMALSAARSALFNAVLQRRLIDGTWVRCLHGEALNPEGRGGFFVCDEPDPEIVRRLAAGELHITGPLWGRGEPVVRDEVAMLEAAVAAEHSQLAAGLANTRLDHERRALRVMPSEMSWQFDGPNLSLAFYLAKGAFATSLLAELMVIEDRMLDGVEA